MAEQLINDSYDYLKENPDAIDACQDFISEGYAVNEDFDQGNMTETIEQLLQAINSVKTQSCITVYRGMNERRYNNYKALAQGESIVVERFTSTSLIFAIANQHGEILQEGGVISILVPVGEPAFFLNAVNDLPGQAIYGTPRQVELVVDIMNGCEIASLDGKTDYANGEEEVLLKPGAFTCIAPGVYQYKALD